VDSPGNWKLETAWVAAATILVIVIFFYGLAGWNYMRNPPADSMRVTVTARQWSWLFTYDTGKKSTSLVVPQGKDVWLDMKSPDVIHGFFIPSYRIKQDIVPGMTTKVWFKATTIGSDDILCTQYCGDEHSKMLSKVFVVPPEDYQKWMDGDEVDIPGLTS
jgi:cytochrome c oxidase subunit 2